MTHKRIKANVRTWGGHVMEIADSDFTHPQGMLLVEPDSGQYLFFLFTELEDVE